jgi:iron complex outermembrane receptor protein
MRLIGHGRRHRPGVVAGALMLCAGTFARPVFAAAPGGPVCVSSLSAADKAALWAAPLDRPITIQVAELTVREAVDRLAAVAHLDLSYSADLLPGERSVCLALTRVPVGAVLEHLLEGSTLRPIVVGSTQVVLAPARGAGRADTMLVTRRSSMLDRVVVTGSPDGAAQRGSPFALAVIDGAQLVQQGVNTLGEALELAVPGVWAWTSSAGAVTARYGSIRGASSFGVSAPKIYLDGIEVANPLLVTQLDPARVARVEVIRGPQGAALYGADAISGVVNILTRHDGTDTGRAQFQLHSVGGLSSTAFVARDPFVQDHSLSLRAGAAARNVGVGLNVGTVGAFVPGASERRVLFDADGRFTGPRSIYTGFTRFSLQHANAGSALAGSVEGLTALRTPLLPDSATGQDMAQYTVGGSVTVMPSMSWTHTVIAGVDGYRLRGLSPYALAGPLLLSSAALSGSAEGAADRASLRLRTVGRFDVAAGTLLTVMLGAEQAFTNEIVTNSGSLLGAPLDRARGGANNGLTGGAAGGVVGAVASNWGARGAISDQSRATYDNTGVSAQAQLAWRDHWFASAGVRAERIYGATPNAQRSLLPMLGVAHVREMGNVVLKVRGAYGAGIRPARSLVRTSSWMGQGQFAALGALDPERQSGTEFGVDLLVGRTAVHVTRFDQRATGLIQPVSSVVTAVGNAGRLGRALNFTLQNVGAITNTGWEVEATGRVRSLSVAGALALVDSRVARLANGYRGDLRVGDRMLDVPSWTLSLSAAWVRGRWTLSTAAIHAADWVGYDRRAVGDLLSTSDQPARALEGSNLRTFWLPYPGVTRWRAGAQYRLRPEFSLVAGGENLLNVQTGAPDNATVIAGRTVTVGVRTTF